MNEERREDIEEVPVESYLLGEPRRFDLPGSGGRFYVAIKTMTKRERDHYTSLLVSKARISDLQSRQVEWDEIRLDKAHAYRWRTCIADFCLPYRNPHTKQIEEKRLDPQRWDLNWEVLDNLSRQVCSLIDKWIDEMNPEEEVEEAKKSSRS